MREKGLYLTNGLNRQCGQFSFSPAIPSAHMFREMLGSGAGKLEMEFCLTLPCKQGWSVCQTQTHEFTVGLRTSVLLFSWKLPPTAVD